MLALSMLGDMFLYVLCPVSRKFPLQSAGTLYMCGLALGVRTSITSAEVNLNSEHKVSSPFVLST
jgi:hypothetical protein